MKDILQQERYMCRVVQLDFTPEIKLFSMLFDRSLSIFTLTSVKQHIEWGQIQLDHLVDMLVLNQVCNTRRRPLPTPTLSYKHEIIAKVPGGHVLVAAVSLAAHGRAGLAEIAVDDVGEVRGRVRAEVLSGRGVHRFLVHDATRLEAVNDARLKLRGT